MRALGADQVLSAVEWGCSHSLTSTALRLLELAGTGLSADALAALPLGERDRLLLALRERTIGGPLVAHAACPHCEQALEAAFDAGDIGLTAHLEAPAAAPGPLTATRDGLQLRFRLPSSRDLMAVEGCADEQAAARLLAARCLEAATRDGAPLDVQALPPEAVQALSAAMAEADPGAGVEVAIACPACAFAFSRELDVPAFFVAELSALARRVLHEVHALARGYGFAEAEILAMSPWRRQAYLGMLGT